MPANPAVLEESNDEKGTCVRSVSLAPDRSLRLEGHHLGPFVEQFFGQSEFVRTVPPSGVDQLRRELSLGPGEDLSALAARFQGPGGLNLLQEFFAADGIESQFWNRIGD